MQEAKVSLRWIIPFLRVTGAAPSELRMLARKGVKLQDFADPDTRIAHSLIMDVLGATVRRLGDPTVGLQAGERWEPGDFDVLEYASRSCPTLRDAIRCASRCLYLLHGGQESVLIEDGPYPTWQLRVTDGVEQLPAANDFALTSSVMFGRCYTGRPGGVREVHFQHATPTSMAEYERIFPGTVIKLGAPHNALVLEPAHLDAPMALAHAGLQAAFELHALGKMERIRHAEGTSGRLRQLFIKRLASGDLDMAALGRQLGMSTATLRRRLSAEGTTYSELLDEVRRELAETYLVDAKLALSEIAFLLGFAHVTAFYKAFKRWFRGMTPAEFRHRVRHR